MEVEEFVPPECLVLQQCTFCSRKFRADVLAKHIKICQKVSKRKAKVFDSGKQRATGTGIPLSKTIRPGRVVPDEMKDDKIIRAENKKNNWRMKHEEFIRNIRAAKQYTVAKAKGRPLPPPPMPSQTINEDLVQCEYCQRRFNEKAAERHIAFCREQQSRMRIVAGKPKKPTSTVKPKVPEPRYVASKPTTQVVSGPHRPPNATRGASSQVRVDASPGPSTTGVHSPPSRGSFVVSPQRGSTGSSGAKPQMTQVATGDSSQLATGSMMSVKRGVPYPRRTPEGRNKALLSSVTAASQARPQPAAQVSGDVKSRFCPECGARLPNTATRFCPGCGVRRMAV